MGLRKNKVKEPKAPKKSRVKLNVKDSNQVVAIGKKAIFIILVFCAVLVAMNAYSVLQLNNMVSVVTLNVSVPQDGLITANMLEEKQMAKVDYVSFGVRGDKKDIVLWEDRGSIVDSFAANYISAGTPVYYSSLGVGTAKSLSYMYQMDGELLKLDVDPKQFGEILVPGDCLNIRASYTETSYKLPTMEEYQLSMSMGLSTQTTTKKQVLLFNNVPILDMLNNEGESIFDIYSRFLTYTPAQQKALSQDDKFLSSIEPSSILISATAEEVEQYAKVDSQGASYLLTVLPRSSANTVADIISGYKAD